MPHSKSKVCKASRYLNKARGKSIYLVSLKYTALKHNYPVTLNLKFCLTSLYKGRGNSILWYLTPHIHALNRKPWHGVLSLRPIFFYKMFYGKFLEKFESRGRNKNKNKTRNGLNIFYFQLHVTFCVRINEVKYLSLVSISVVYRHIHWYFSYTLRL